MSKADQIIDDAIQKSRSGGTMSYGDNGSSPTPMTGEQALLTAKQAFNAYVSEIVDPIQKGFAKDLATVKEKAEILDGSRSGTVIAKSAVRFEDMRYLDKFPSVPPNFRYASTTPTAADFNALYADVKKLYELMGSIAVIVSKKL